jgi:hypothetical protein
MSLGTTGIVKSSTVDVKDIEILYSYSVDRTDSNTVFTKVADSSSFISNIFNQDITTEKIQGLYQLKLSKDIFNKVGIYNILIRPKQIKLPILDIGVLSALPNVKGIIIDTNNELFANDAEKLLSGALTGYRIEYINTDNSIQSNLFRTVTYSNRCEPIIQNLPNTTNKSVSYRLNDNSGLLFLTVTPSVSSSIKPNSEIFIGTPNQNIILSNTFFDPLFIEIELTEYDLDTLALAFYGEQTRSTQDGVVTYYDKDRNIYKQFTLFEIKDENNTPLYEVKEVITDIDESKSYEAITNDIIR